MIHKISEWIHEWKIKDRRVNVLANHICRLMPHNISILDVGCGDGKLAKMIAKIINCKTIHGIDVLLRKNCAIPVTQFDGENIPFDDNSFDYILLVDVLHHTLSPEKVFSECVRVCSKGIILKDHISNSSIDYLTLRFMDKVGNSRYDVELPHNYLNTTIWNTLFSGFKLKIENLITDLDLYPSPLNSLFDRKLHAIWHLTKS
jgi:SAM-dependent methyltransferase